MDINTGSSLALRSASPFDDSAVQRHKRMGLLEPSGAVNTKSVEMMARLHAGLFFDQLCDASSSFEEVAAVCSRLISKAAQDDAKQTILLLSLEYDFMRHTLPEAIWWIAGSSILLPPFTEQFIRCLSDFLAEVGGT